MTAVLASDEYITANEYTNSALFWALRGGGGGTFGVLVMATYCIHEILPLIPATFVANFSKPEIAQNVVTKYIRLHPNLSDADWGDYSGWSNTSFFFYYPHPNLSVSDADATMTPLLDHVTSIITNPEDVQMELIPFTSFYEFYTTVLSSESGASGPLENVSRLLSREMAKQQPEKLLL
ncbi:hypothetical protein F5887DRAFT_1070815 [Amanita rubescens]|nr:hypothetical protein F5887DRAFT_1070815 [Amanita rubescens]